MLSRRPDGLPVDRLPLVRRFMPFVIRRRNEALVWFEHDIEVDSALEFARRYGNERDVSVTFFHLVLRSLARVFAEFPKLNRYVVGRRLYQRTDIAISFSGKESFHEDAPLYVRKQIFDPSEPLEEMVRKLTDRVRDGRAGKKTHTDTEMQLLARLPRPLVDIAVWGGRFLDYFNLLPRRMVLEDPLYATAFVANLGSVGISAAYHHLYEYGTIPVFVVVGAYRYVPVAGADGRVESRRVATIKYTYDERVEDGFYCARAVARVKELLEAPDQLA
ncbi:MAG: 2-oxo acid dehydrogenase subunit E2 [Candidatus Binatia bacterium]